MSFKFQLLPEIIYFKHYHSFYNWLSTLSAGISQTGTRGTYTPFKK